MYRLSIEMESLVDIANENSDQNITGMQAARDYIISIFRKASGSENVELFFRYKSFEGSIWNLKSFWKAVLWI